MAFFQLLQQVDVFANETRQLVSLPGFLGKGINTIVSLTFLKVFMKISVQI